MKRLLPILVALLSALAIASAALAKGPTEASIDGPGLGSPLTIRAEGEDGLANGSPMMVLAEGIGFFPAAFGPASWNDGDPLTKDVNPMLARRPSGALGPRYVVTYVVPGPEGIEDVLRQDLYPYAASGPASYMPPGQPFFGWRKTTGGWYQGGPDLKEALVAAGMPRTTQGRVDRSSFPWTVLGIPAVAGAAFAAGAVALALRRRPRPGGAQA